MGQKKRKVVPSRHLICGNCASWVQHEGSGFEKKWADTKVHVQGMHRGGGFGARSGRSAADGGGHEGDGCRTAV